MLGHEGKPERSLRPQAFHEVALGRAAEGRLQQAGDPGGIPGLLDTDCDLGQAAILGGDSRQRSSIVRYRGVDTGPVSKEKGCTINIADPPRQRLCSVSPTAFSDAARARP